MKKLQGTIILLILVILQACQTPGNNNSANEKEISDPLPSWNDGQVKSSILKYVSTVTDTANADFVPASERIATFDNDGTLWSEQPMYFQLFFAIDRIKALSVEHPEWIDQQPYKAVLDNDLKTLMSQGMEGLLQIISASHAGTTTDEFEAIVENWVKTARHPKYDKPFTDLVYQPMLELLNYLRANEFKVFIVSGGGIEFMRPWTEEIYGIPKDQVIGSAVKTSYDYNNGTPVINRLAEIDFIDDKEGKPEQINKFIGRKPIFAAGNSDGDLQMLRWADANSHKSFQLYVHHTDSIREWAYDRGSHIGGFDKGWDEAVEKGWTVVDMAQDWKVVYPFDNAKQ